MYGTIEQMEKALRTKPASHWNDVGVSNTLTLFHQMAKRVPAYKDFLACHGIDPLTITREEDLEKVPSINKDNYLRKYPYDQLCWDGDFQGKSWDIFSTSGSTGDPFYFLYGPKQVEQYAALAELFLRNNFSIHKKSTLVVNCFPMGIWIGGLFTFEAIKKVSEKDEYALSIINPGINKAEILNTIRRMGKQFDQVIMCSYGPFLKDTLDDGIREGISWSEYNLGFIFAAEGFTESFRDFVINKAGLKNAFRSSLNIYGSVDLGAMAYETPLCILIRRIALKHPELYAKLFGDPTKLPTLAQYLPDQFYFQYEDHVLCSSDGGIPLLRYDLKDLGGVMQFEEVNQILKQEGYDLKKEARNAGIADAYWKLPFVSVYERADFSVSLYAFQIYPETIRRSLQNELVEQVVTGKFTMMVKFDEEQNQYLEINAEMKADVKYNEELEAFLSTTVTNQLLRDNSEFRETYAMKGDRLKPKIVLWNYEDPTYFKPGTKQKWSAKAPKKVTV